MHWICSFIHFLEPWLLLSLSYQHFVRWISIPTNTKFFLQVLNLLVQCLHFTWKQIPVYLCDRENIFNKPSASTRSRISNQNKEFKEKRKLYKLARTLLQQRTIGLFWILRARLAYLSVLLVSSALISAGLMQAEKDHNATLGKDTLIAVGTNPHTLLHTLAHFPDAK